MAFGKKKNDDPAAPEEADDALTGAFAASDDAPEAEEAAGDPALDVLEEPAEEPAAVPATEDAPAPDALGGADALLGMFNSSESLEDDRSVILDLAGDADLSDLLEDLHTVAAALGLAAAALPTAEAPPPLAAAA